LNPDRGEPFDPDKCVKADFTLTLGGAKTGFEKDSSAVWTGSVSVVDLDLPAEMLCELSEGAWQVLNLAQAREWLGARPRDAHKGTFGHVSLIGGSPGMTGAIRMAARAALHTGSGLVTVLTPQPCATVVSVDTPEIMVYGGKVGQYGKLCSQPFAVRGSTAVLIGPGMGVDYDTRDLTDRVVEGTQVPLVLDADALRNLPNLLNGLSGKPSTRYLTPHPGEMGFLLQTSPDEVQADRSAAVRALHQQMGAHAVLKGSRSRMLTAGGEGWLNLNGNPGMATAGAGDVLSGMVVSLAGQGLAAEAVLPLATYLHGKAGDLASMRKGQAGMRAGDIVDAIPAVMRRVCGR
jgi:NAD(P)H-hydrate epimerase